MITTQRIRELLSEHGPVQPQPETDWTGSVPLPAFVKRFYSEIGPVDITIKGHGNPFFLPRLTSLWQFQTGYRWHGLTGERLNDWKDEWLVVAGEGGNPFVVSLSSGIVSFAMCGAGTWQLISLFSDLPTMAACLAMLGLIASSAGKDFTDEDCLIRPQYCANAKVQLAEMVGSSPEADVVLRILGWTLAV